MTVKNFRLFNPQVDTEKDLPDKPGNYFIILREGCQLPSIKITPIMKKWDLNGAQYDIVYTGVSTVSLRKRDYAQHFTGNNAGRSTLRKSLGSMMGFRKIPRDKNNPGNGKTKFCESDEEKLSQWMRENLLVLYAPCGSVEKIENDEIMYIKSYNPPLNIQNNANEENEEFRKELKRLRNLK